MKTLVIYDSNFGNTQKVAEVIAKELNAEAVKISDNIDISNVDLLIVGSPINGWKPTPKIQEFLASLKSDELKGKRAAAFDTRVKLFIHGDAAAKITKALKSKGAEIISEPGLFYVKGQNGPLLDGELEKAKEWAKLINR